MGAWIETDEHEQNNRAYSVAPHVGAWIETDALSALNAADESRPTWARGLKPQIDWSNVFVDRRAPRGRVD